ncbi:unnamed protein product [Durusdinium trenchii]|uniref:NAD(P)-binding domain-containing protein n=1 Tax=Durusdinium trenchii TaxID=1381693 RepID=A0ABP0KXB3_9DINO
MAIAPLALGVAATSLTVAAVDRVSKSLARPGVANEGLGEQGVAEAAEGTTTRRLVVLGASGGSGVAVVEAALERNYHVVAFARDQQRLNRELGHLMGHASLEVALGEISDLTALLSAMQGAQAVICTVGPRPETAPLGTEAWAFGTCHSDPGVEACRKCQIERLIVQGCALTSAPGEWWGLLTPARLARAVVRWQNSSKAIDDAEAVMKYLYNEAKDVKWVVARPVWLEEGEARGALVPNLDTFTQSSIRYADLALWLLEQVDGGDYVQKMPRLKYGPVEYPI